MYASSTTENIEKCKNVYLGQRVSTKPSHESEVKSRKGLALVSASCWGASSPWLAKHHTHDHDYDPLTPEDQMPRILNKGYVTKVVEGDDVILKCDVIKLGNFTVIWHKETSILWVLQGTADGFHLQHVTIDGRISNENTSFVLRDVRMSDEGSYSCELSSNPQQKIKYQLIVNVPPSIRPIRGIDIVQSHEGETVELECQVQGKPRPEVTWEKVGEGRYNATTIDTILSIPNVTSKDAGDYACIASNGIGEAARSVITLNIQYPPTVSPSETAVHSGINYQAILQCYVDAAPRPKVEWYKEGGPVNPLRLRKGIEKENKYFLQFRRVLRKDFGFYSCNASNYWGNDSAIIELTGRPLIPEITSPPYGNSQNNYSLTWDVKSYASIISYFVFLKNASTDYIEEEWVNVTVPGNPTTSMYHSQRYILKDLTPGATLVAKVQAINEFGESEFSPPFTFRTLREEEESLISEEDRVVKAPVQESHSVSDEKNGLNVFSTNDVDPSLSDANSSSNPNSLIMPLKEEEEMQNNSSMGTPSMKAWEKRSQLMSFVTAISLSCFFYLFAMR